METHCTFVSVGYTEVFNCFSWPYICFIFPYLQARNEKFLPLRRKRIMATPSENYISEEIVPLEESVRNRNIQQKLTERTRVKAFGNGDKMECAIVTGREMSGLRD